MKISQRLQHRKAAQAAPTAPVPAASIDVWLQRISHLAQVGVLGLGVFGYFYTVLPVFQNQQLQEQAARLELEKSSAQRQLDELLAEQKKVQNEISSLRDGWQRERGRNAELSSNAEDARRYELLAKQRATEAEGTLAIQMQTLNSARWELVVFDFFFAYVFRTTNASIQTANQPRGTGGAGFIQEQEGGWPRPYDQLVEAVDLARKKRSVSQVPDNYYTELKSFVEERRGILQCELPDFSALEASYQLQLAAAESTVEAETRASIEKLVKEYADKNQRVQITDEYRQSVRRNVRLGKIFELERSFDKRLAAMRKSCEDKSTAVFDEFRKLKDVAP